MPGCPRGTSEPLLRTTLHHSPGAGGETRSPTGGPPTTGGGRGEGCCGGDPGNSVEEGSGDQTSGVPCHRPKFTRFHPCPRVSHPQVFPVSRRGERLLSKTVSLPSTFPEVASGVRPRVVGGPVVPPSLPTSRPLTDGVRRAGLRSPPDPVFRPGTPVRSGVIGRSRALGPPTSFPSRLRPSSSGPTPWTPGPFPGPNRFPESPMDPLGEAPTDWTHHDNLEDSNNYRTLGGPGHRRTFFPLLSINTSFPSEWSNESEAVETSLRQSLVSPPGSQCPPGSPEFPSPTSLPVLVTCRPVALPPSPGWRFSKGQGRSSSSGSGDRLPPALPSTSDSGWSRVLGARGWKSPTLGDPWEVGRQRRQSSHPWVSLRHPSATPDSSALVLVHDVLDHHSRRLTGRQGPGTFPHLPSDASSVIRS